MPPFTKYSFLLSTDKQVVCKSNNGSHLIFLLFVLYFLGLLLTS